MKREGKYEQYKAKNAVYNKKFRAKQKVELLESPEALQLKRSNDRARQSQCRARIPVAVQPIGAASPQASKTQLHRATNKVVRMLPKSPRKTKAIIRKLTSEFRLAMKGPEKKTRLTRIAEETLTLVKIFFCRDDISRMAPGKRDVITVRSNNEKEKRQKRHMVMNIRETFAVFKDENPNIKIEISKLAELRPPHVLLNSQMPANVCVCLYHENFILAVDALQSFPNNPIVFQGFPTFLSEVI